MSPHSTLYTWYTDDIMDVAESSSISVNEAMDTRLTSLIIHAIKTSEAQQLTLSDLYIKLVELNPSLSDRKTDWQGTVRHTLSASTLFVRVGKAKGGMWKIDPKGDRSTHRNRRTKRGRDVRDVTTTDGKANEEQPKAKRRLGTTRRMGEFTQMLTRKSSSLGSKKNSKEHQAISTMTTSSSLSPFKPLQLYTHFQHDKYPTPRSFSQEDHFVDGFLPQMSHTRTQQGESRILPSQFVNSDTEPFPPAPQLDAFQKVYSQSSSSISFSQSQSQ